jgi:Cu(I)/Ag(I) efflux system membrane protein CusA/SilA
MSNTFGGILSLHKKHFSDSSFIQKLKTMREQADERLTGEQIMTAVRDGTSERVRPIVMTSVATIAGLLPIMWGSGTGSDVMQRIAAPTVGGMVSTTTLSLLVLPVIYGLVLQWQRKRANIASQGELNDSTLINS